MQRTTVKMIRLLLCGCAFLASAATPAVVWDRRVAGDSTVAKVTTEPMASTQVKRSGSSASPLYYTAEDEAMVRRYLNEMAPRKNLSQNELMVETARFFLGAPYVAATLEKEPEGLVVNLREMDCTTFVENVLALVRTLQSPRPSFDVFCRELQTVRYRDGRITGYPDRLHYMSDWIWNNERRGIVRNISREAGGEFLPLHLSFISTHPEAYKQLKQRPDWVRQIAGQEEEINRRTYYYVPKTRIDAVTSRLQSGDIVCFVTTVPGLDVSHVGILLRQGKKLTFIHASTTAKQVIVNPTSLQAYTERMKSNRGILLARPLPRAGSLEEKTAE